MLKNKPFFILTFLFLVLITHIFVCNNIIKNFSPTYDEPLHLFQGYSYLKTGSLQTVAPYDHPILAKIISSLGLLLLNPNPVVFTTHPSWENKQRYSFANLMLYYNNVDAQKMLNTGRWVIVFCSGIFLVVYFLIIKHTFNLAAGIFGVVLYVFNNTIVFNTTLTTQDFLYSIFYFLSLYYFCLWFVEQKFKFNILSNIFCSIAFVTKFSAIILWTSFGLIFLLKIIKKEISLKKVLSFLIMNFTTLILVVLLVYKFEYFTTFFQSFVITIKNLQSGRSTFFLGKHSTVGFREYFLTLFMLKTEIPLLIFVFIKIILDFFVKKEERKNFFSLFMLFNIVIYLTVASFSKTQIGIRHLLPIYLIIIYYVSDLVTKKHLLPLIVGLSLWYIITFIKISPWHISYFNELCGGPKNGFKYFTDSNIDWGQGLKQLSRWLQTYPEITKKGIYLSYFGVGDPHYYGIKYRPIGFVSNLVLNERVGDDILKNKPEKIYFAISVTNLQSTYYKDKEVFSFLKNYSPETVVAYSIFVYEITKDKNLKHNFIKLLNSLGYVEDVSYLEKL